MQHTPGSNLPYPDGTDGPDGPGGIAALALALDMVFLPVTMGDDYNNQNGFTEAVQVSRLVVVNLSAIRKTGNVTGNDLVATLPPDHRPAGTVLLPAAQSDGGSWKPVTLFLSVDGAIRVTQPTGTGNQVAGSLIFRTGP